MIVTHGQGICGILESRLRVLVILCGRRLAIQYGLSLGQGRLQSRPGLSGPEALGRIFPDIAKILQLRLDLRQKEHVFERLHQLVVRVLNGLLGGMRVVRYRLGRGNGIGHERLFRVRQITRILGLGIRDRVFQSVSARGLRVVGHQLNLGQSHGVGGVDIQAVFRIIPCVGNREGTGICSPREGHVLPLVEQSPGFSVARAIEGKGVGCLSCILVGGQCVHGNALHLVKGVENGDLSVGGRQRGARSGVIVRQESRVLRAVADGLHGLIRLGIGNLMPCRQRGGRGILGGTPRSGLVGHFKLNDRAVFRQLRLEDTGLVIGLAVDGQTCYVNVFRAVVGCADHELLAVFQMDGNLGEQRRAKDQLACAHAQGIDTHGAEDVPSRLGAVVLVADIASADLTACITLTQYLTDGLLRAVGTTGIQVHVGNVQRGLVVVLIVAHLNLNDLVDHGGAAYTRTTGERSAEKLIQLGRQCLTASVQVHKTLSVMRG